MANERIRRQIDRLLDDVEEAIAALQWEAARDLASAVLALDKDNAVALAYLRAAEARLAAIEPPPSPEPFVASRPALSLEAPAYDTAVASSQTEPGRDPLAQRVANIRLAVALVLAGFLLNAAIVVFPVAVIGGSVLLALLALGVMVVLILLAALYGEVFKLRVSGARPLLPGEFPWLEPQVRNLARRAGISVPQVLLAPEDSLNAFTTGTGVRSKIVFYRGLLDVLSRDEVEGVAAHELGHVVNRDISLMVWTGAVFWWVNFVRNFALIIAAMIVAFVKGFFESDDAWGPVIGIFVACFAFPLAALIWVVANGWAFLAQLMELAINRQREYLADATAIALTGRPVLFAQALARISDNPSISHGARTVGKFCIVSPLLGGGWWEDAMSTHPPPGRRIEEVMKLPAQQRSFAESEWRGTGSLSTFLPAGAVGIVAVLALCLPLLSGAGEGGSGSSYRSTSGGAPVTSGGSSSSDRAVVGTSPSVNPPARAFPPTTAPTPSATAVPTPLPKTPIQYGQSVQGTISSDQQRDTWSFTGKAGDVVTIRLAQQGGASFGPTVRLLDPGATEVKSDSSCNGSSPREAVLQNIKLAASGQFAIRVQACGGSSGGYRLTLSVKPPAESIPYGAARTGNIALGDYQQLTFAGNAGDLVTILLVQDRGASARPIFSLTDGSGAKVADGQFNAHPCDVTESRLQNYKLAFSGTFTIRVSSNCNTSGGFRLTLLLKPPPGAIAYGQERTGALEIINDYNDWQFAGAAGDVIAIRVTQQGGAASRLRFLILDPSGAQIASGSFNGHPCDGPDASLQGQRLAFTGTYTIRITSNCNTVGGYRLTLTK